MGLGARQSLYLREVEQDMVLARQRPIVRGHSTIDCGEKSDGNERKNTRQAQWDHALGASVSICKGTDGERSTRYSRNLYVLKEKNVKGGRFARHLKRL